MRQKGIFLTRLLEKARARFFFPLALGALMPVSAWPGTELGNARFVPYSNGLHGIHFEYPEQWNVIDLGDAVNVVEGGDFLLSAPDRISRDEESQARGDVQLAFDEDTTFATPIAFERYVRKTRPLAAWKQTAFAGRLAYQTRSGGRLFVIVQKDNMTAMHLNYPLDNAGEPSPLVEKTVSTITFQSR